MHEALVKMKGERFLGIVAPSCNFSTSAFGKLRQKWDFQSNLPPPLKKKKAKEDIVLANSKHTGNAEVFASKP